MIAHVVSYGSGANALAVLIEEMEHFYGGILAVVTVARISGESNVAAGVAYNAKGCSSFQWL